MLREEWGFDGAVVTDWWAEENGARQQAAGNDLLMPGSGHQYDEIMAAVRDGSLPESVLDRNVGRILKMTARTNSFAGYEPSCRPDLEAHARIAREAGTRGMVLLENDGTLPLKPGISMALFGNAAYDTYVGGTGSGNVNRRYKVNICDGFSEVGFDVFPAVAASYRRYIAAEKARMGGENFWWMPKVEEMQVPSASVKKAVAACDAAVYVLGRMAADFPLSGGSDREVAYTEDIFVGYRHFDRSGLRVRYPFGYGLSYTDFAYEDLKVARSGNVFNASLTVSNTGTCAGREVVQLYVSSPAYVADRPLKELKSFAVTPVLMPGESCRVTMRFDRDDLSVWENGRWAVKRGKYRVYAASSAEDIRSETVVSAGL